MYYSITLQEIPYFLLLQVQAKILMLSRDFGYVKMKYFNGV